MFLDHRHPDFGTIDTSPIQVFPGKPPVLIVLAAFFPTAVWQETLGEYNVVKVMLQRVDTQHKPSYHKGDYSAPQDHDTYETFAQHMCQDCDKSSPAIFKGQPNLCLNYKCKSFFSVGGNQCQRNQLEYSSDFLTWNKPFSGDHSKMPIYEPTALATIGAGEYGTELRFRGGWICPQCRHCNSREKFSGWTCSTCGANLIIDPEPFPMADIKKETKKHTAELYKKSALFKKDGVTIFMNSQLVTKIVLEDEIREDKPSTVMVIYCIFEDNGTFCGTVVHERPGEASMQGPCGADELWNEFQEPEAVKNLKRNAATCPGCMSH